jgi:hypothetical protein
MSWDILRIIPSQPHYVPDLQSQEMVKQLFSSLVNSADEITTDVWEDAEFVDQGGNFESVMCPNCGTDLEAWWIDAIDEAYAKRFRQLNVEVPCCGAKTSLNDLSYFWPAGFARFCLSARNPNIADLGPDQLVMIGVAINCPVRKIWAHY